MLTTVTKFRKGQFFVGSNEEPTTGYMSKHFGIMSYCGGWQIIFLKLKMSVSYKLDCQFLRDAKETVRALEASEIKWDVSTYGELLEANNVTRSGLANLVHDCKRPIKSDCEAA